MGWRLNGVRGGLIAGTLFVLPGLVAPAVVAVVVPFPLVIVVAAGLGWALHRRWPAVMTKQGAHDASDEAPPPLIADDALHHEPPSARRTRTVLAIGLTAWLAPLLVVVALTGTHSVYTQQGVFFSGTAVLTFGGAYAVLA